MTKAQRFADAFGSEEIRQAYLARQQAAQPTPSPSKKRKRKPRNGPGVRGVNRPRTVTINGAEVPLIGLGGAAKMVGVTKVSFRAYDDNGVIPRNRMIDELSRRWYPVAFIQWLVPFFDQQSTRRTPLWEIKARVERAWPDATVPKIPEDNS